MMRPLKQTKKEVLIDDSEEAAFDLQLRRVRLRRGAEKASKHGAPAGANVLKEAPPSVLPGPSDGAQLFT